MISTMVNGARLLNNRAMQQSVAGSLMVAGHERTIAHLCSRQNDRMQPAYQKREFVEHLCISAILYFSYLMSGVESEMDALKRRTVSSEAILRSEITHLKEEQELLRAHIAVLYKLNGIDMQEVERLVKQERDSTDKDKKET